METLADQVRRAFYLAKLPIPVLTTPEGVTFEVSASSLTPLEKAQEAIVACGLHKDYTLHTPRIDSVRRLIMVLVLPKM